MKQSLAVNATYNMIYRFLDVAFPLISAGYVARILSADGVGKVAYAQNIMSYFLMFATLGIPSYGIREIARVRDNKSDTDRVFSELLLINGLSTGICLLCFYTFACGVFTDDLVLYLIVGLEIAFNFLNIDWYYQGKESYRYIMLRSTAVKSISLATLFLLVKDRQDYPVYALIHCLGVGCNYFFNVIHARKTVQLVFGNLNIKRHIVPIMWLMMSAITASMYNKIDITMLGAMTNAESVAYYTNAHKIISIVLALVTAISSVFLPRLSYVYVNDRKQFSAFLNIGLKIILCLALPACFGIILVAENLMTVIFGEAFLPGAGVIRILAVFTIIKSVGDLLCYQTIIGAGKERTLITSRVTAGVANVVLNSFLIPRHEHEGAAIASVISEFMVNGMLLPYALSIAKIHISKQYVLSIAVATLSMAAVTAFIQKSLNYNAVTLCLSVVIGILIYGVVLVLTGNELIDLIRKKFSDQ